MKHLALTATLVATMTCGGSPTAPDAPYGQRTDLKAAQSVRIGDDGLKVTFLSVKSDSRCPMNAICVDAGNAVVAFRFDVGPRSLDRELHTRTGTTPVDVDRYAVMLLSLQPYPMAGQPTAPGDYVAQIQVDKR